MSDPDALLLRSPNTGPLSKASVQDSLHNAGKYANRWNRNINFFNSTILAMESLEQAHHYTPLPGPKWLRLLRILSVNEEEAVCSLEAFDMNRLPKYNCLSYTWGDPMSRNLYPPDASRNEMSASCDKHIRHADGTIIRVTENLVQALKRLAKFGYSSPLGKSTPQYLWIDAICINQGDNDEKSSQVAMMDVIYSHSETVIVWLGEEDFHTAGALKIMRALAEVDFNGFEEKPYFDDYDAFTAYDTLLEAGKTLGLPYIEAGEWRDYAAFLQRKWFERIWVLQEKVFAKNTEVFVGSHRLSWDYIIEAASILKQSRLANPLQALYLFAIDGYDYYRNGAVSRLFEDRLNNYQIFADISKIASTPTRMETLLYHSKRLNATQPLDHVYAILGIWKSMRHCSLRLEEIRVDYTASVAKVYAEATLLAIQESGNLGILSLVESRTSAAVINFPSWVPDYSQKTTILPLTPWPRNESSKGLSSGWNASRGLTLRLQSDTGDRFSGKLSVKGLKLDVIEEVGPTYQQIDRQYQWAELLQVLNGCIQDQGSRGASHYDNFWRTLIKDTFRNQPAGEAAEEAFGALVVDRLQGLRVQVQALKESIQILQANKADLTQIQQQKGELDELGPLLERTKGLLVKLSERIPQVSTWSKACEQRGGMGQNGNITVGNDDDLTYDENATFCMLRDIESSFWAAYSGRRLFRTKTGLLGISNQALQRGDDVWILARAETPFILRISSGNEWLVVGEAYVHGVMEGEKTEELPESLRNIVLV